MTDKLYTFRRESTGKEYATVAGPDVHTAEDSISYSDIMDHEDYEWTGWKLVSVEPEFVDEELSAEDEELELEDDYP